MVCPFCYRELKEGDSHCPACGSEIEQSDEFVFHPVFIKWYEILNYLIKNIGLFALIIVVGYVTFSYIHWSLLLLILLFPLYFVVGYFNTCHLERLYAGVTFTFSKDSIRYENDYYPHLNGEISYDDVSHMVAYQNFLDYFFGIGHIKIKSSSNPRRGMILCNIENPNEMYQKIKEMIEG